MGLLDDILGSFTGQSQTTAAPASGGMMGGNMTSMLLSALMAIMASKGAGGGLGSILGGNTSGGTVAAPSGGAGGLGGMLGGLLGGGGGLAGGLGQLLQQFQQNGHGDVANSWVTAGPNRAISPNQLLEALGPDTVDQLSAQTGVPRDQIGAQLSHALPQVVDKLTPEGRLPTHEEASQWV